MPRAVCTGVTAIFAGLVAAATAIAQSAATPAPRQRVAEEYTAAFRDLAMVPVLVPRDHAPGDVLLASGQFRSRASDCFAALDVRTSSSMLVNVEMSWSAAARVSLLADGIAAAAARGQAEDLVRVRFENVRAVSVSRVDLARKLERDRCPELARSLDLKVADDDTSLLIGDVLYATPIVTVERAKGASGGLSFLSGLLSRFGWSVRGDARADLARAESADLTTNRTVAVAFRPAFVLVTPGLAEKYSRASRPKQPALEAFDPGDSVHRAVVDSWAASQAAEFDARTSDRP